MTQFIVFTLLLSITLADECVDYSGDYWRFQDPPIRDYPERINGMDEQGRKYEIEVVQSEDGTWVVRQRYEATNGSE